jgi:hypothetical protein
MSSKIETITPEMAKNYLSKKYDKQRPLSRLSIEVIAKDISSGVWVFNGEPIIFASGVLVDGQHRLEACVLSGKSIKTMVVNIEQDPAVVYASIDSGIKRQVCHVLSVPNATAVAFAAKILYRENQGLSINSNNKLNDISAKGAVKFVSVFPELVSSASAATGIYSAFRFMSPGEIAYCHLRASMILPEQSKDFFRGLSTGVGLSAKSPILALRNALVPSPNHKMNSSQKLALFIIAFNHFYNKKQVSFVKFEKERQEFPAWCVPLEKREVKQ